MTITVFCTRDKDKREVSKDFSDQDLARQYRALMSAQGYCVVFCKRDMLGNPVEAWVSPPYCTEFP